MYRRIEAGMVLLGLNKREVAKELGIGYNTLLSKLKGDSSFTLDEAVAFKKILRCEESIEELFDLTAQPPTNLKP